MQRGVIGQKDRAPSVRAQRESEALSMASGRRGNSRQKSNVLVSNRHGVVDRYIISDGVFATNSTSFRWVIRKIQMAFLLRGPTTVQLPAISKYLGYGFRGLSQGIGYFDIARNTIESVPYLEDIESRQPFQPIRSYRSQSSGVV